MARIWFGVLFVSVWLNFSSCQVLQFNFVHQSLNWTEAQTYCRDKYVDLVTIQNPEENSVLLNLLSAADYDSEVWIGLFNEIDWRWSDGFSGIGADYRNWTPSKDEPNFASGDEFCVTTDSEGTWRDVFCHIKYPFLCYNGTQLEPEYVYVAEGRTWADAQKYCREFFIDLATVRNKKENQMALTLMPFGEESWIGLSRSSNSFQWSDGRSFLFFNPDGIYNPLGSMKVICGATSTMSSGKYMFLPCETKLPFVCYSFLPVLVNKMFNSDDIFGSLLKFEEIKKRVVKLRLKTDDLVDLNEDSLKANILKTLQDKLAEHGVSGVTLKMRQQADGEVFKKENDPKKTEL